METKEPDRGENAQPPRIERPTVGWRVILFGATFAALVWGFRALLFKQLPDIFTNDQEDMSFGWYVPLFSLYVLWTERKALVRSLGAPSLWGLFASLPFLFIGFLGVRGVQIRFGVLAFAGLCLTLTWAFFGRAAARRVLFPSLFLLFCIPLATFLDVVTVHLRLFAVSVAYAVLKGVGADVVRTGTSIASSTGSFAIDVAAPCSGLRSIFALMALTAGYAYFNQPTWTRRLVLFATSVPLAILGNVVRILTICLVAAYASSEFATGFYHDYSGYVVFVVAILLMVACGEALTRLSRMYDRSRGRDGARQSRNAAQPVPVAAARGGGWIAVLTACLVAAVMWSQSMQPDAVLTDPPDVHLGEIPGYTWESVPASESEKTILPADTQIEKRLYRDAHGAWHLVALVIGGRSKSSIHRPELCLPAQGFLMTEPRTVELADATWRVITLDGGAARPDCGFAYTFFNQEGYRTCSHVARIFRDVCDRSFRGRIDRWAMITVFSSRPDGLGLTAFLNRLSPGGRP